MGEPFERHDGSLNLKFVVPDSKYRHAKIYIDNFVPLKESP